MKKLIIEAINYESHDLRVVAGAIVRLALFPTFSAILFALFL